MNKKVFISMLILTISFLVGLYILKIFFPAEFMICVQNEQLIEIGNYIDTHQWLRWTCRYITSFITYWLFCCACSQKLSLKWYECIYILIAISIVRVFALFDTNISSILSVLSFVVLPAIMNGSLKNCAIVYSIHGISQGLSLTIRNLALYLRTANYLTIFVIGIESYFWLILLYVIFNYNKKRSTK